MQVKAQTDQISLCGAKWAAKSEAYASLISEHLSPDTVWLDAGCGSRLLENDMDPLESWLTSHCKTIIGMDVSVTSNRNISSLRSACCYHPKSAELRNLWQCHCHQGIAREIASPHCPRIRFAGGRRHLSCALQSKHNASPGSVVERFRFASS